MKNLLCLVLIALFNSTLGFGQCPSCATIMVDNNTDLHEEIKTLLDQTDPVITDICIDGPPRNAIFNVVLDDDLTLSSVTLRIKHLINLDLGDKSITLTGTEAKLIGENYWRSRITVCDSDNTVSPIMMESCENCEISNINIDGCSDIGKATQLLIDSDSNGNSVNSILFTNSSNGVEVQGDHNDFSDLVFLRVSGHCHCSSDCIVGDCSSCVKPCWDTNGNDIAEVAEDINKDGLYNVDDCPCDCDPDITQAAIHINNADYNVFHNVIHNRSPGAVTLWLEGDSDHNEALNITVEQERSKCSVVQNGVWKGDPSVFVDMQVGPNDLTEGEGNIIQGNFNGGWFRFNNIIETHANGRCVFCVHNTFYQVQSNCDGVRLCIADNLQPSCND